MLRSPLHWVGGKSRLRERLLAEFPPHVCYVELFAGAAWVLFGKDATTSKCEVLNDLDGELVNFWRVMKHRPAEFAERVSRLLVSRELFDEWKPLAGQEGDELERAARFYCVIRTAYGAKRESSTWTCRRVKRPNLHWVTIRAESRAIFQRLRVVWIERLPWEKCIAEYDSTNTLFYVDPPYHCAGARSYHHYFSDDDHRRLAEVLVGGVKGKWLLSYNDDSFIRNLYTKPGISIGRVSTRYGLQGGLWKTASELLIRNY